MGEGPSGIPEIRRFLAVKGFRELKSHLQEVVAGRTGEAALRMAIRAMRDFAHQRPGLSAASFRSEMTDCPAWRQAGAELAEWLCSLLAEMGVSGVPAAHALRTIRAFVRGFVIHEMQGSFLNNSDLEESFLFGVDALVWGLRRKAEILSMHKEAAKAAG